jgi:hypothetical protein
LENLRCNGGVVVACKCPQHGRLVRRALGDNP